MWIKENIIAAMKIARVGEYLFKKSFNNSPLKTNSSKTGANNRALI
jgi:hypothetical protein